MLDTFWQALVERRRDMPGLLRTIADRVVEVMGDGCVLTTVTDDGTELRAEAIAHSDKVVADAMREVLGRGNVRIGEGIAGRVAADRRPVLLNDLPAEVVDETTPVRFLPFVRDHPMQALMIVPLVTGGELLGTLGAVRTRSPDHYTPATSGCWRPWPSGRRSPWPTPWHRPPRSKRPTTRRPSASTPTGS
jgi:GAF domain-containing protein